MEALGTVLVAMIMAPIVFYSMITTWVKEYWYVLVILIIALLILIRTFNFHF